MSNRLKAFTNRRSLVAIAGLLLVIAVIGSQPTLGKQAGSVAPNTPDIANAKVKDASGVAGPIVGQAVRFDTSPPLGSVAPGPLAPPPGRKSEINENPVLPGFYNSRWVQDSVVQKPIFAPLTMPLPIANFDGVYNYWGPLPPDTNGEVGPYHYFQTVNSGFQIFSKTGTSLYGPANNNVLWRGFGGPCESHNDGDPIIMYDQLANRWNLSQFTSSPPYYQCIAISSSGDPLGTWHRYAFLESASIFGDYPHLGTWPDGYYMTVNQFGTAGGGGNYAFERDKMLRGESARFVYFSSAAGGALPADLDGMTPPPAGSPNYFLFPTDSTTGLLTEYKFHTDWLTPTLSTFRPITLTVAPWNSTICGAGRGACIDQPNTAAKLEALADRFMFRLAYRNLGDHESLVVNHTVSDTTNFRAGIRWYEIRQPMTPTLFQQGTYNQPDSTHRWMGSIAMDRVGNIAIGYSASSSVISPSVRYTGRLVTDPSGQMSQGEGTFVQGMGVETYLAAPRWGDYSDMTVDPADDCTFWFTTEYFSATGDRNWRTRVGSFKFPNCGPAPTPTPCVVSFSDVPNTHPFYEFIRCLYCRGAISGYADGTFRPYNNTTRGQLSKIVVLGFGLPTNTAGGPHFSDVAPDSTFYGFIETAFNAGLISGYQDGTFRPNNDVTRGQLSKIVVQAASNNLQGWLLISPTTATFSDVAIGSTFFSYIETAACHGIISGYSDGTFRPGNNATRAQISKIVCLAVRNEGACSVIPPTTTPTPAPTNCAGGVSYHSSITNSDPIQFGRINRSAQSSSCLIPKLFPGTADANPRHYKVFTYTAAITQCVTIRLTHDCGNNHLLTAAYLDSYDPGVLNQNYLGDMGSGGQTMQYSVNVPGGHSLIVVVNEGVANVGCSDFTLNINPCAAVSTATPTTTSTPAPTEDVCSGTTYNITTATATIVPGVTDIDNHCDDCTTAITLPFPINLYGQSYNTATVSSNGNLQFVTSDIEYDNSCLPAAGFGPTIIAYWDDLLTSTGAGCAAYPGGCGVFISTTGTAPSRVFNIEWRAILFAPATSVAHFEMRLYEGQTSFNMVYGQVDDQGANATVGVQRSAGRYTQFSCDTASLMSGLQLNFNSTPAQCTATPTPGGVTSTPTCVPGGWSAGPNFPSPIVRGVGIYYPGNSRFYTLGGRSADTVGSDLLNPYEYNPATNTWTQKSATFPNSSVNNMAGGILTVGGQSVIVVVGGSAAGGSSTVGDVRVYNPTTDALSVLAGDPWPAGAISSTLPGGVAVYNNKLYIIGGFVAFGTLGMVDSIWEFDPARPTAAKWQLKNARLPVQLGYVPATTIGNFIYTGGGDTYEGTPATLVDSALSYRYDPTADVITALPNLPQATGETRAVNWGGNMWVLGGGRTPPNPGNMVQIYNPTTSSWSLGTPFTTARRNFPMDANPGNAIYLVGGYTSTGPIASMEIYRGNGTCPTNTPGIITFTPTRTFTPTTGPSLTPTRTFTPGGFTPTPTPTGAACNPTWIAGATITPGRIFFQGALGTDQKFYIAGGQIASNTATAVPNFERFDPTTNTWSTMAPLQVGVGQDAVGASGGKVYVAGGFVGGAVVTSTLQIYDIATNSWSFGPSMPGVVEAGAGVALNNMFYVIGGDDFTNGLATVYRFDIAANTWTTRAPLPAARTNTSATAHGGFIYVFGGAIGAGFTADDHLLRYDPTANTWLDLGSAGTAARGNYGTVKPFGANKLLVTDGGNTAFVPVATTHIYDVAANTWSAGPTLITARMGQAGGTLADGRIVEAGGYGVAAAILNSSEILPSCGPGLQGVQITGFAFSPPTLNVARGVTVRWTNMDPSTHDTTSNAVPPVWGSGPLPQNQFYHYTFNVAGTYTYICSIHPSMTGSIIVAP